MHEVEGEKGQPLAVAQQNYEKITELKFAVGDRCSHTRR